MELAKILDKLGYLDSPHFLQSGTSALRTAPDFGHVFRKALKAPCHLEGVYTLRRDPKSNKEPLVPVAYVCTAKTEADLNQIHRLVWNQDVVPFLLVNSPGELRFYSGFRYQRGREDLKGGVLRVLTKFNEVADLAESFGSEAIDSGRVWKDWGKEVTPETRVDWKLLDSLRRLDEWLRKKGNLEKEVSHALIGKYVYLHYLRDRKILSPDRMAEWGLDGTSVFGRKASRKGLQAVTKELDDWLNGSVFPLKLSGKGSPNDNLISAVAATFAGDQIVGDNDWQLHFDFQAYDFSYIPIETLSVIYEQFLHTQESDGSKSKGEEAAAYYTPIPVVNFMLSEMDEKFPLKRGMKVFDPACGSGAFLVQGYRRLIEREFPATKRKPTPQQLKELLQDHIFGVDNDSDACSVTELSLILTLLDYVEPPDLLPTSSNDKTRNFKLPTLSDQNIFHANFFKLTKSATTILTTTKFDWIIGNPPWKDIDPKNLISQDEPVWAWMSDPHNKKSQPCGDNEVAQAFAWRVQDFLASAGSVALLLPAMTLFDRLSAKFRQRFLQTASLNAVSNFTNITRFLFGGRSLKPSAAFFFDLNTVDYSNPVRVFSPMLANQEIATQLDGASNKCTWAIVGNWGEVREVCRSAVASGDGLPWKMALWGSPQDSRLLAKIHRSFSTLGDLIDSQQMVVAEGPALVSNEKVDGPHKTRFVKEVVGKKTLNVNSTTGMGRLFSFPENCIEPNTKHHLDLRGSVAGLNVCAGPHIVVSAAFKFAVFVDDYLVVPRRQFGIVSTKSDSQFLKSLALFLSSDFAFYHQFFTATELGIKRDRINISTLRSIPIPPAIQDGTLNWTLSKLHAKLARIFTSKQKRTQTTRKQKKLFENSSNEDYQELLAELNSIVSKALKFDDRDCAIVADFVHVKLQLNDGKVGENAVRQPLVEELRAYARRLKKDLDAFVSGALSKWHQIGIVYDKESASGMIQVELIPDKADAREVVVAEADNQTAKKLDATRRRLRKQHSQWVYFDRNLRIYEGAKTFVFKPLQRFHWTESQAMQDASEIIAETLQLGDDAP